MTSRIVTPRMRWCIGRIQETFGVDGAVVDEAIKAEGSFELLDGVLSEGGPSSCFVFYQPVYEPTDSGDWILKNPEPQLVFARGWEPGRLRARGKKACYFLRLGPIDKEQSSCNNLVHGELGDDPLKSLELSLSRLYQPLCESRASWGQADEEQTREFLDACNKVSAELKESIKSLYGGLELRKPDKRFEIDGAGRNLAQRTKDDQELVDHFEGLLEEWCDQIETYLESTSADSYESSAPDAGPMTELEAWKRRMQRLTSITEQLKTKDCKTVIAVLSSLTKNPQDSNRQKVFSLLRRWKQIDINITEAANEAKDNVKYLFTLEKFIEPLYSGTPESVVDTLPALMNSIKMIHTIARYYNTMERMTNLFSKITNQMISCCKKCILVENPDLWSQDPEALVQRLEACLKLNDSYQENYRLTKDKLLTMPKGKQFDFSEQQIFGKFDLFCRRVIKLIDMFSTIHQFRALANHKLEGMEALTDQFQTIISEFRRKNHDLLDYHNNKFDRDYVEFNVAISDLESSLQQFINDSFERITSIENSLNLLKKFQAILQRENLKSDLDSKFNIIFQNYGLELEVVQQLYERHKHAPPIPRNLPPVSGNIMWSRHLLKRIEEPMKKFESNQNVLSTKDAKRIIKTYNKVARTLVAFEYLWFQAWQQSIETAKAGLQATLIIRHPDDDRLYVNFDQEILQLIREAKCLDRMGIDIPESAKIVLLQETKFKSYYNDLQYALKEYERVTRRVIPVAADLLKPHMRDMEYKLRPGMITLTWTSMNIDAYKHHIHTGLAKLEELVTNINDIIENRIEKNLKVVSKTVLVDLPSDRSTQLSDFVAMQEKRIRVQSKFLHGKNVEIEHAVNDLMELVQSYPLDPHIDAVSQEEITNVKRNYRFKMYCALLKCTKNSLNMIKERVGNRGSGAGGGFLFVERPFFELFVNLQTPKVQITPDLEDVQSAINKSALAVLKCSKSLYDWDQDLVPEAERKTFFDEITCDLQIAVVCLLLTGSVQGLKQNVTKYLERFYEYQWLWSDDKDRAYSKFMATKPTLPEYEAKLMEFQEVDRQINEITSMHVIGAMSINTSTLKNNLRYEVQTWKLTFSRFLHEQARGDMEDLYNYMKQTEQRLKRSENIKKLVHKESSSSNSDVLQELSSIMDVLREIRERESGIEQEISPVLDMYSMLERFVGSQGLGDQENDNKEVLRYRWECLVDYAERVTDELGELQESFKRKLLRDIKEFVNDVIVFRNDFVANGPMVPGISPKVAVDRLRRFHEEYEIRERKFNLYRNGEELFALQATSYPELTKTKKELVLLDQLYKLYTDVIDTIDDWKQIEWEKVRDEIDAMAVKMDAFATRCKKMPGKLRDWDAYKDLKKQIDEFTVVLPLLQALAKPSIMQRHWTEVSRKCGTEFVVGPEFRLCALLDANLIPVAEDIEEICDSADKQLQIQNKIAEIAEAWQLREFDFVVWKSRGIYVFKNVLPIVEDLEDSQMQLQTMLTMRHVFPFKNEAQAMLVTTSDTAETLERWIKVQTLWCSLESVFSGGDIAKQLPMEAKKFQKIDKDFDKVMRKAFATKNVIQACQNDILKQNLIVFYNELEKCQKSLEGYLEQKRNKFPRFYFVSNPVLLQVLSQGSDPLAIQPFYEKIFDSIDEVVHDAENPQFIEGFFSRIGVDEERIPLSARVQCKGNIEDWLMDLLAEHRNTMKDVARDCAARAGAITDASQLRPVVDALPGQFALLAIQLNWSADCAEALHVCKQKKTALKDCSAKAAQILSELSSWCLTDLGTKMNRIKMESLVTIQVHQRDVITDIAALHKVKKISDPSDFEWQKQCRFEWRPDGKDAVSDSGALAISITDIEFNYSYEYLGCRDRLVITPLTDRCYITLAQALGMGFGGAPAGPAGTGKTETVKDMGRALGVYVMVSNCSDQFSYLDCAKIFKGLCQGGLWGCFDEFNRITLPVLSVVAQQVLAIQNAKKAHATSFSFPGDPTPCHLNPVCGFFITMNPGYAGRQELPENLKSLFRGVAMMVPDRMIIMKVKLCSVGYTTFTSLAKKFAQLYKLCEEQLSQQKHYDFGLRNILSVLRTCGANKRENLEKPEDFLMYRTLRDMNLSKLVAQDVPLFLSLLTDLFPKCTSPPVSIHPEIEPAIKEVALAKGLILEDAWVKKVVQLYETYKVRHGIMLVGPTGGGKTEICNTLAAALSKASDVTYKFARINPKAIRAAEMYGEVDKVSGEWTTGVFAATWAKMNQRSNRFNTWLICDGPVDAIWIEDLNTVLDDNKILTLANGDRIPMTDQNRILFEVESLRNASPATVSRAGIIYVSESDLDWYAVAKSWMQKQDPEHAAFLATMLSKWIGTWSPSDPGELYQKLARADFGDEVIQTSRVGKISNLLSLLSSMMSSVKLSDTVVEMEEELEKLFVMSLLWSFGGNLEPEGRQRFDDYLRTIDRDMLPELEEQDETSFEYVVDLGSLTWQSWDPEAWEYPVIESKSSHADSVATPRAQRESIDGVEGLNSGELSANKALGAESTLDFSNLLVPTMDSTRACFLLDSMHQQGLPVMMVGGSGTAKTSTALMFFAKLDPSVRTVKRVNFSSATKPIGLQNAIESELDKRGGKNFGPAGGKKMTVFLDDISMPSINEWGDQPTLEFARQLIEFDCFAFLDKDKRGDMKHCEDLQYVAAMAHPGGGHNDVPSRLKRHFFIFNMVLPSMTSINNIYGQMLAGRFSGDDGMLSGAAQEVIGKLTSATIQVWQWAQRKFLPTPRKFHYVFNMRDVSRVFQGILLCPKETILNCSVSAPNEDQALTLVKLWKHECERVFCDKLVDQTDKLRYLDHAAIVLQDNFGDALAAKTAIRSDFEDSQLVQQQHKDGVNGANSSGSVEGGIEDLDGAARVQADMGLEIVKKSAEPFVNFLRDDVLDADGDVVAKAPKVYEHGGRLGGLRERVADFMLKQNAEEPSKALKLVLFDDALNNLLRISRIISMPRGSALLVGVGGSGKQSLTKLASYIAGYDLFQITPTKSYNVSSLLDDLRSLYRVAGQERRDVTFLFTDQDIKEEGFLEVLNMLLMTGEIPGLFSKEDMIGLTADLEQHALRERGADFEISPATLRQFFFDSCRDRLHVVLCMSPVNVHFAERARKFPGLINCCTINWFLRWPDAALKDVANGLIGSYHPGEHGMYLRSEDGSTDDDPAVRASLVEFMGSVHRIVVDSCTEYEKKMRRQVYQTPKSYLSFIDTFKVQYETKLARLQEKEERISLGLEKLIQGAADVEELKLVLAQEQEKLLKTTKETNRMIGDLETKSLEAKKEQDKVNLIKGDCEEDAARIKLEKEACEQDLAQAQPYLDQAESAIKSIKPAHINEVKKLAKPSDIIKLVFDGVLILFKARLNPVKECTLTVKKQQVTFVEPSYSHAQKMMGSASFLKDLLEFSKSGKDLINDETIEFMMPYLNLSNFTPAVAKSASAAAEGLCTWVHAMRSYHEASKIVKPKLEALALASSELETAQTNLDEASMRLDACKQTLHELQDSFNAKLREKAGIEENAKLLQKKMTQAASLINGLANERRRWSEDKAMFAAQKRRLVGDVAVSCAFVSYCGAFNQEFREDLVQHKLVREAASLGVPVSEEVNPISFLVDAATVSDWGLDGLPSDPLSVQNGILVTQSSRYPLLVDPQGQALNWLVRKETRAERLPSFGVVQMNSPKLREHLELAMSEGLALIVAGVEEDLDPMLDPVLEKEVVRKGKSLYINVADKACAFHPEFTAFFVSRLPNPHFSPELQAKTTVVDFTVTLKGLEDQLLDVVIGREQKALQDQLEQVIEDVAVNTKLLMSENDKLLYKLTSNSGSLLDDEELVTVLKKVKETAETVKTKLRDAEETRVSINEKREQYRPVATRGAVLYFSIVECSALNCMYQTSLQQFNELFLKSTLEDYAPRNASVHKRVHNIIEALTYLTYRYINRGLYEKDKLTFVLVVTMKVLLVAGELTSRDMAAFFRGAATADPERVSKKKPAWMPDGAWLHAHALAQLVPFFRTLPEDISKSEAMWKMWFENPRTETMTVPDYEDRFEASGVGSGAWNKLQVIRALRVDRTIPAVRNFVRAVPAMGARYVDPVTDTIESVYEDSSFSTPIIYLLSLGADPTDAIQQLGAKKKRAVSAVSMGQGQEPVALKALDAAMRSGGWVLLQNCDLGLNFMAGLEETLKAMWAKSWDDQDALRASRVFLTAAPNEHFPMGILQMGIKVTNEAPQGIRAGMLRAFSTLVDQDRIDRVDAPVWRQLLYTLCFLHCTLAERRKFGPLGWSVPYEFSAGDMVASVGYLEKALYSSSTTSIAWPALAYIVGECVYGGKITDALDRRLMTAYADAWLNERVLSADFRFNETDVSEDSFSYSVCDKQEHADYLRHIQALPEEESAGVFGLHPNAELKHRLLAAGELVDAVTSTQPGSGVAVVSGAGSVEEATKDRCNELLSSMPSTDLATEVVTQIINEKRGGFGEPLNVVLSQECALLQRVVDMARFDLVQLVQAIDGEITLTETLATAMHAVQNGAVPRHWLYTVAGDLRSWMAPSISSWFETLCSRHNQLWSWLNSGPPSSFWLAGLQNKKAFITATLQAVARAHRDEEWALDDVVVYAEVSDLAGPEAAKSPPKEGVLVHGLFLEGARWVKPGLAESEPKQLFAPMPLVYLTATTVAQKMAARASTSVYECPLYTYPRRTGQHLVTMLDLPAGSVSPEHWTLRGVAVLCNQE
ncbi:Dynein heavy chain 5, axonemal [Hondaea fermentalgiana]|uniref:Dynein heavy chain 5, axonemal n=1 Tax=Hondaea fermentalgiana TaxID=2315210 RepID=A0A2R5GXI3_9STRA|nr:Dynein heavy chain 5, axonemal [Hondaea fermentalgiana]|eukprot:GBG33121.1 Dynein heavy chain 5, axonemal [Hondaea fermentalgiana]